MDVLPQRIRVRLAELAAWYGLDGHLESVLRVEQDESDEKVGVDLLCTKPSHVSEDIAFHNKVMKKPIAI